MFTRTQKKAKVLAILNQKGGVGKTTLCFQMAHAFAHSGKKVLCLDMDPQANLSLLFTQENNEANLHHLLINSVRELKALHTPKVWTDLLAHKDGVDILPAGQELSGFELTVAGISGPRQFILSRFLDKSGLLDLYDFILIDGPPTLGLLVVNILCAAQGVLVPFQADAFSRKGLGHFHQVLEQIEDMGVERLPKILGYVPNLVDARRKLTSAELDLITQDLLPESGESVPMFAPIANRVQLTRAQADRKSVFQFHSKEFTELKHQFLDFAQAVETSWPES